MHISVKSLGHTMDNQGHIPKGKMSVQFFLKDLRESVDNQYLESECETVERPVTSSHYLSFAFPVFLTYYKSVVELG